MFELSSVLFETGEVGRNQQNPNSLLSDFWFYDSDTTSHADNPEHEITWLNEYVENSEEWYRSEDKQYEHLAYAGLICQSSNRDQHVQQFLGVLPRGNHRQKVFGS